MARRLKLPFDGETYDHAVDGARLTRQLDIVRNEMLNGSIWWTLAQLEQVTGFPQSSISARLRDLRKGKHGGYVVERRRVMDGSGQYQYRLRQVVLGPTVLSLPLT